MAENNPPQKKTPTDYLSYTTAQCNPTVEMGPDRKPKIKPLPKEKAADKTTQTQEKDKSK